MKSLPTLEFLEIRVQAAEFLSAIHKELAIGILRVLEQLGRYPVSGDYSAIHQELAIGSVLNFT